MKKLLAIILTTAFVCSGLWLALFAAVDDSHPLAQGGLSILAAVAFCAALLCAGWGNSLTWKGGPRNV